MMRPKLTGTIRRAFRDPRPIPEALLRRALGRKHWVAQGNFVTFKLNGFVAAPSPPLLLARHHYETIYIQKTLGSLKVSRSLEIGCGFGRLSPIFAAYADRHEAIDINEEALNFARVCYPTLRFSSGSATSLPFNDDSFDLISTWTVLQHIRPQLIDDAVRELRRVLRPEGYLLLCEATRSPGATNDGIWDRHRSFYERAFSPLQLKHASYIRELDRIPGLATPGEVMFFVS